MKPERDMRLAEALRREVDAPPFDHDFSEGLWRRIDHEDTTRQGVRTAAPSQLGRMLRRRRYLLATAAAVAAAVLAAVLTGVPGLGGTQPPRATAAMREVAAIDAGLARVKTFQGTIVFDGTPAQRSLFGALDAAVAPLYTAHFALCANGDSSLDVRYGPVTAAEVARMRHQYALRLAYWRRVLPAHPKGLTAAQVLQQKAQRRDDLLLERAVTERCVFVCDETTHRIQMKRYEYDVFTGRFLGIRYKSWRGFAGVRDLGQAEIAVVLSLATQVRSALADRSPDVTVSDTSYEGRPAQAVVMRLGSAGVWRAVVDRTYGVVLSFQRISGRAPGGTQFVAFHIDGATVNAPVAAARFVLRPDYRYTPEGTALVAGAPNLSEYNMAAVPVSYARPSSLHRQAVAGTLAPAWVPAGYRLAEVGVSSLDGPDTTLIYRRGLSMFSVDTDVGAGSSFGVFSWVQLQEPVLQLHGGALSGWPAETTTLGLADATSAWPDYWGEGLRAEYWGRMVAIEGDLSHAELLRVADSLQPVNGHAGRAWGRLAALAALAALLVCVAAAAAMWSVRRLGPPGPRLIVAVAGCFGVAAGLALDWHDMAGAGSRFATSGWSETPGLVALACALAALCATAWLPLVMHETGRRVLAGLVAPLSALALCAVGAAVVYPPASARFTIDTAGITVLQQYVLGRSSVPTPALGMVISAAGAIVLLASALRLRRRAAASASWKREPTS